MLVGRSKKESTDRARVVLDLFDWLDPGEGIAVVSTPVITLDPSLSDQADPTPLSMVAVTLLDAATKIQFLLDAGTPGLNYGVKCQATGAVSGRRQSLEFNIAINELPVTDVI